MQNKVYVHVFMCVYVSVCLSGLSVCLSVCLYLCVHAHADLLIILLRESPSGDFHAPYNMA